MSLVAKGLWIGNIETAFDEQFIKNAGINCIINLSQVKIKHPGDIHVLNIDINDHPDSNIDFYFDLTYDLIDKYESVLVHCFAGVSRSSTIVLNYIMIKHGLTFEDAYRYLKKHRSIVRPNSGFIKKLKKRSK